MEICKIYIDDVEVYKYANWDILDTVIPSSQSDCNILCVGLNRAIDDKFMLDFPNVSYILCPATCVNHIVTTKNVEIISLTPSLSYHISASAEFTLFLILASLRRGLNVLDGQKVIGNDIYDKTVGFIGFGRIGNKVAKYLKPLECQIIWNDIRHESSSKSYVLQYSDIVVLSMTADKRYANFIGQNEFNQMRKNSYFINISRGFLVCDKSLLCALEDKKIAGAALDVVENISVYAEYLESEKNLIITSHVAGSTIESHKKACDSVLQSLKGFLDDKV